MVFVVVEMYDCDCVGDGDEIFLLFIFEVLDVSVMGEVCFVVVEVVEG